MGIRRPGRRSLLLAAIGFGLLAVAAAVVYYGLSYSRHLEVQRQLAAYKAEPNEENAGQLIRLLATGRVSRADAQDVLQTWLDLKVDTERPYRPNTPFGIVLTSGNKVAMEYAPDEPDKRLEIFFTHLQITLRMPGAVPAEGPVNVEIADHLRYKILAVAQGVGIDYMADLIRPIYQAPEISIAKPGVYTGVLTFEATTKVLDDKTFRALRYYDSPELGFVQKTLVRLGLQDNPPGRDAPEYRCVIEVPFQIRVEDALQGP